MAKRLLLLLTRFVVGSATVWADTSLIETGSFETGALSPWSLGTDYCPVFAGTPCNPWHATSSDAHSGFFSLEDQGAAEVVQSVTPTFGILITQASFWFKQDPVMGFAVELFYSDGSSDPFFFAPTDGNWNQYNLMGDIELGKELTGIGFASYSGFSDGSNGPSWLDDVTITSKATLNTAPVPEPPSMIVVAIGIASLATMRKRK